MDLLSVLEERINLYDFEDVAGNVWDWRAEVCQEE